MANVINLPTYEQTEEIRQNVEDIGTLVNDTSGVFIGTDGKKYKAIFEEGYRVSEIMRNKIGNSTTLIILDSVVIGYATDNIYIYDKETLRELGRVIRHNANYTFAITGSGIIHNVAEDNGYIYVVLRNSGGGYAIDVISKTTWQRVGSPRETGVSHAAVGSLSLYSGADRLYIVHVGVSRVSEVSINYQYVPKSDVLAHVNFSTALINRAASNNSYLITSVNEVGDHIYVVEKLINNAQTYILKYDKSFNLIAQTSSFIKASAATGEIDVVVNYSENVITFLSNVSSHIELNTQTMAVNSGRVPASLVVFHYDVLTKEAYTPIPSLKDFYFAKFDVVYPSTSNTQDPKVIFKIVPPKERMDGTNRTYPFIHFTNGIYLIENSGAYSSYKLEAINVIAGYKEVL